MGYGREFFDTNENYRLAWREFMEWQPTGEEEVKLWQTMTWKGIARRYYERHQRLVIEEW